MSENSKIQWTDDTYNPWRGCTKVSEGCKNCYAEKLITNRLAHLHYEAATSGSDKRTSKQFLQTAGGHSTSGIQFWGKGSPRIRGADLNAPLRWNKKPFVCECGQHRSASSDTLKPTDFCSGIMHRRRVFSLSLGDWLDDEVPIAWLAEFLDVVRRCENLDWLLVTKRPELWEERLSAVNTYAKTPPQMWELHGWLSGWLARATKPPANVMILTSVENQKAAEERIPALLKIPAARRGLSCEPLLGPVDLDFFENGAESEEEKPWAKPTQAGCLIDWVIVGGESGTGARQCYLDWIRSIQSQCKAASIPCFVKQLGANAGVECLNQSRQPYFSQIDYGKKGDEFSAWPADLQVREFYK